MPQTEERPASDQTGGARSKTASETRATLPPPVPPGATPLYVAGLWVVRHPTWRDTVDLATAPRHVVYAAGLIDGAEVTYSEMKEFAALMADRLQLEQAFERAQRQVRRRAS